MARINCPHSECRPCEISKEVRNGLIVRLNWQRTTGKLQISLADVFSKCELGSLGSCCCSGLAWELEQQQQLLLGPLQASEGDPAVLFLLSCLLGLISQVDRML